MPSRPLFKAYTHTDPYLVVPTSEIQGTAPPDAQPKPRSANSSDELVSDDNRQSLKRSQQRIIMSHEQAILEGSRKAQGRHHLVAFCTKLSLSNVFRP